jgi:hypothetical protein
VILGLFLLFSEWLEHRLEAWVREAFLAPQPLEWALLQQGLKEPHSVQLESHLRLEHRLSQLCKNYCVQHSPLAKDELFALHRTKHDA